MEYSFAKSPSAFACTKKNALRSDVLVKEGKPVTHYSSLLCLSFPPLLFGLVRSNFMLNSI